MTYDTETIGKETIGKYISMLYRAGNAFFNKHMEPHNIGSGQYPFILSLYFSGGITQEELSCKLSVDKGTTAKAIKKLIEEGYVKREVDEKDKRAYKVYLTEEGRKATAYIFKVLNSWNDILTSDFSKEEKELALKLLKRMFENKVKYLGKENYK